MTKLIGLIVIQPWLPFLVHRKTHLKAPYRWQRHCPQAIDASWGLFHCLEAGTEVPTCGEDNMKIFTTLKWLFFHKKKQTNLNFKKQIFTDLGVIYNSNCNVLCTKPIELSQLKYKGSNNHTLMILSEKRRCKTLLMLTQVSCSNCLCLSVFQTDTIHLYISINYFHSKGKDLPTSLCWEQV